MSNLEELNELNDELIKYAELVKETTGLSDPIIMNLNSLNLVLTTYLLSIAKSLAIIADKMSEKKKED